MSETLRKEIRNLEISESEGSDETYSYKRCERSPPMPEKYLNNIEDKKDIKLAGAENYLNNIEAKKEHKLEGGDLYGGSIMQAIQDSLPYAPSVVPGINITKAVPEKQESFFGAMVQLMCTSRDPNYIRPWTQQEDERSTASSFVTLSGINNELVMVVTNAHAVSNCVLDQQGNPTISARCRNQSEIIKCTVAYINHESDVAILSFRKIPQKISQVEIPENYIPKLLTKIVAIGFPNGVRTASATVGGISRYGMIPEAHSHKPGQAIQIDAAINHGNSGGAIFKLVEENKIEGTLIAMAFQGQPKSQGMGFGIPSSTIAKCIRRFVRKYYEMLATGRVEKIVDVYLELGIRYQSIHNPAMHDFYNLGDNQGVLVIDVPRYATGQIVREIPLPGCGQAQPREPVNALMDYTSGLKVEDVILYVDNYPVGDDGTIMTENGRTHFEKLYSDHGPENKYMKLVVLRKINGIVRCLEIDQELIEHADLVPKIMFDRKISYIVFSGFIFTTLSLPLIMMNAEQSGPSSSEVEVLKYGKKTYPNQEVVVLTGVLSCVGLNDSYEGLCEKEVESVNNVKIWNLQELHREIEASSREANPPGSGYVKIKFKSLEIVILDYQLSKQKDPFIFKQYQIPPPGYFFSDASKFECTNKLCPDSSMQHITHTQNQTNVACHGCKTPLSIVQLLQGLVRSTPAGVGRPSRTIRGDRAPTGTGPIQRENQINDIRSRNIQDYPTNQLQEGPDFQVIRPQVRKNDQCPPQYVVYKSESDQNASGVKNV